MKEIHWLLNSLNDHMHGHDHMQNEVHMWRKRYILENMKEDTQRAKEIFMSLPSSVFDGKDIDDVANEQCRI